MELHEVFRRLMRNASLILGSRLLFGLVNLGSSAVAVHAIGLQGFGVLVLLQAYARLFIELLKFESWQAVLSYGTSLYTDDRRGFRRLIGLSLTLDIAGVVIGIAAGILFIPVAAGVFDWPDKVAGFAPVYLLSIPFMMQATANGILRLLDRVDVLVYQHATNAIVRLVGVSASWWLDGGLLGIVITWFLGSVISGLVPVVASMMLLRRERLLPVFRLNVVRAAREFPGIWRFLAFSNASSSIGFVYSSGLAVFVGATLDAAAAASLQIAQQFARAIGRPARLLGPIISPEFSRLVAAGEWETFRTLILRQLGLTIIVMGGFSVILFVVLDEILAAIYTDAILGEIWIFRLLILSAIVSTVSFALEPSMLAAKKPGTLLIIRAASALTFVALVLLTIDQLGLVTVGLGSIMVQLLYLVLFLTVGSRLVNKRIRCARAGRGENPLASHAGAPEGERPERA